MNQATEVYVLLWSQRQGALHVETLDDHLQANRRAVLNNTPGDYRAVHMGNRAEVDAWAELLRPKLDAVRGRAAA